MARIVYHAVVCPLTQLLPHCLPCCCLSFFAACESHTFVTWRVQGGTSSLAYLAWNPDASEDIGVLVAIAPVVYATYLISPTLVAFSRQANVREPRLFCMFVPRSLLACLDHDHITWGNTLASAVQGCLHLLWERLPDMSLSLMQKRREQKVKAQQTSQLEACFPVRTHLAACCVCIAGQLCKHLATPDESRGDSHSREGAGLWCHVHTHRLCPMACTERHHEGNLAWTLWLNLDAFRRSRIMNPTPAMKLQCFPWRILSMRVCCVDWLRTAGSARNAPARWACWQAITELVALLTLSSPFGGWDSDSQRRVLLTLYLDHTLGWLHCRAVFPKDLEWTTPWGSLLQGCFQTRQGITASLTFL